MEQIKKLLIEQKEQIEKDLESNKADQWTLKVQQSKLAKMLKQVNKQLETASDNEAK